MNCTSFFGLDKLENRNEVVILSFLVAGMCGYLHESGILSLCFCTVQYLVICFLEAPSYLQKIPSKSLPRLSQVKKRLKHLYPSQVSLPWLICCLHEASFNYWREKEKSFYCLMTEYDLVQVRKMAYVQGNSVPHANLEVLDKLIATRHEFAQVIMLTLLV